MSKYRDAFNDIVDHGVSCDYFNKQAEKPQGENTIFIVQELVDNASTPTTDEVTLSVDTLLQLINGDIGIEDLTGMTVEEMMGVEHE